MGRTKHNVNDKPKGKSASNTQAPTTGDSNNKKRKQDEMQKQNSEVGFANVGHPTDESKVVVEQHKENKKQRNDNIIQKSFDPAIIKEIKRMHDEKLNHFKTEKTDPMFSHEFVDHHGCLAKLLDMGERSIASTSNQSKYFIGIVQASMTGKTRLLIEVSVQRPMILVSFKKNNTAYTDTLLRSLHHNTSARIANFEERLAHNRRIILKVRLFFLAFLDFGCAFLQAVGGPTWYDLSMESKRVLAALLLNGGGAVLDSLFQRRLEEFDIDNVEPDKLKNSEARIREEHRQQSRALGNPWFALDECHVPDRALHGVLFHSDYKSHQDMEQVFRWQQYEQFPESNRGKPEGYPYKRHTTLFSAIRWVVEEFLNDGPASQLTIFATTYLSCWETILDNSSYSREKPLIQLFDELPLLTEKDIDRLVTATRRDSAQTVTDNVRELYRKWTGRPGFFFEHVWPGLQTGSIKEAFDAGEKSAIQRIESLLGHQADAMFDRVKKKECIDLYRFSSFLHNKRITDERWVHRLVSAGVAIKKGNDARVFEPLVVAYLEQKKPNWSRIGNILLATTGMDLPLLAEHAVALTVIQHDGKVLTTLLERWGCMEQLTQTTTKLLRRTIIRAIGSADFAEFSIKGCETLFDPTSPLWHNVVRARTGLRLPDLMFTACDGDDDICLISIQIKTWQNKPRGPNTKDPNKDEFADALASISRPLFCKGHSSHGAVQQAWLTNMKQKRVLHLRIIICSAGFTAAQQALVLDHNKKNPKQPILLVYPALSGTGAMVYGSEAIFFHIRERLELKEQKQTKKEVDLARYKNRSFMCMQLQPNEQGWQDEDEDEEEAEDSKDSEDSDE